MPHLFRHSNHSEEAETEGNHHHHRPHNIFSRDTFVSHSHHDSHTSTSPHGSSSNPGETASARAAASRRANYPEALPSALSKRYTGPVVGTAVLDENVMPLEDAAVLFEMVTPESTPLLKSHVKERFEAAIDEALEARRQERQQQRQQPSSDSSDSPVAESPSEPAMRNNTFSFFKIDESAAASIAASSSATGPHHRRRHILNDGGYVVFTDSYLSAHPNSVVTGVTSELQLAANNDISAFHHPANGPDAEKQRLQEVKDYIREVEHEYRPLFRRRTSAMVYGRGQYLHTGSPEFSCNEVYYATPIDQGPAKVEPEIKKSSNNKLRKVFSSPLF